MVFRTWSWHPASARGSSGGIGRVPGTERVSVNIFSICYGGVRTKIIVRGPCESDEGWALSAHPQSIHSTLLATDVSPSPEKVRDLVPSWQLKKLRPREIWWTFVKILQKGRSRIQTTQHDPGRTADSGSVLLPPRLLSQRITVITTHRVISMRPAAGYTLCRVYLV